MITEILVIGSGISGLTYAIKIGEQNPKLQLTIISKNNLLESQHQPGKYLNTDASFNHFL